MSAARWAALAAAGVAAVAVGAVVGAGAERHLVRAPRERGVAASATAYGEGVPDRTATVLADDGVELAVAEFGPEDAPLTVVLVHGLANDRRCWQFQVDALVAGPEAVRVVAYDHRGHGASGRGTPAASTLEQLAADLASVLAARVPSGPVVLLGHSMGGMTLLALAEHHPEVVLRQVAGVGLLSTSAGRLAEAALGPVAAIGRAARPVLRSDVTRSPAARRGLATLDVGRRRSTDLSYELTRRLAFPTPDVDPGLVEFLRATMAQTPLEVIVDLLPALLAHERAAALAALAGIPVLVCCGTADSITPPGHSEHIAAHLPHAELLLVEGAGHMAHLERPETVTPRVLALVAEAAGGWADGAVTWQVDLPTAADTRRLGATLGALATAGDLVVLAGPLGAGKTVVAQGVGEALGVAGVTSPTFVIAREHRGGRLPFVHVDAYRLGSAAEVDDLDLDTALADAVLVVEWGEGLVEHLAASPLLVHLDRGAADEARHATLTAAGPAGRERLARVVGRWRETDSVR